MKRLIPLLLLAVVGCGTSSSYKSMVAETYPKIGERMDRYPLTADEAAEVQTLRAVAAKRSAVRYDTARPAWEAVEPDYRRYISADAELPETRRSDWLRTADLVDEAQDAEAEYQRAFWR